MRILLLIIFGAAGSGGPIIDFAGPSEAGAADGEGAATGAGAGTAIAMFGGGLADSRGLSSLAVGAVAVFGVGFIASDRGFSVVAVGAVATGAIGGDG